MKPVVMGTMITFLDYLNPVRVQAPRLGRQRQVLTLPATAGADRYGRGYPPERRQIVGPVFHLAVREPYNRLNDAVAPTRSRT